LWDIYAFGAATIFAAWVFCVLAGLLGVFEVEFFLFFSHFW